MGLAIRFRRTYCAIYHSSMKVTSMCCRIRTARNYAGTKPACVLTRSMSRVAPTGVCLSRLPWDLPRKSNITPEKRAQAAPGKSSLAWSAQTSRREKLVSACQKAAEIWYRSTAKFPGKPTFASTRADWIVAAGELYGVNSSEVKSVWNALRAINVGSAATDTQNPYVNVPNPTVDNR